MNIQKRGNAEPEIYVLSLLGFGASLLAYSLPISHDWVSLAFGEHILVVESL